jgi:hypothetical protein
MKPITRPGDYLATFHDPSGNEINQKVYTCGIVFIRPIIHRWIRRMNHRFGIDTANEEGFSCRVMRVIDNSKYNTHSPSSKQKG